MSVPIKLTKSGTGIASAKVNTSGFITLARGIADPTAALNCELWVTPAGDATTNGTELGHLRAAQALADSIPAQMPVADGQYILANFVDAGAAHEVWVYFN